MKTMSADEVRNEFLKYFEKHDHRVQSSYPLVPPNDPTLLFTNAGMVQFKDVFTGKEKKDFKRATSSQKCVRAGGKHNDLENVGFTARHHTFFEMLGNFSFGDYFKKEAIRFGWEFLVDVMGLSVDKLYVTVFAGDEADGLPADEEAAEIWHKEIGVAKDRILRFGKKDNFWSMGDTGPCGPCSEVIYDQGEAVVCNEPGGCRGLECECDRYLEIWNLVFMQFDRDATGTMSPLPAPSIDTGMGLERLAAVVKGVTTNYDTDLFLPIIDSMAKIAGIQYGKDSDTDSSLRVVADHARATAFLMSDGILPSNEGRGYVLRRIMRRAIRHGSKLGVDKLFFHEVCQTVVERMREAYPELSANQELIEKASRLEEETFRRTLNNGLKLLTKEIGARANDADKTLPGKLVFDLQTRDGFPPDLTAVIASEQGFAIDEEGYKAAFQRHQEVSSGGLGIESVDDSYRDALSAHGPSQFSGYENLEGTSPVLAILAFDVEENSKGELREGNRHLVKQAEAGQTVDLIVANTPFYGESGGQVGDTGWIEQGESRGQVTDTLRPLPELIVHRVQVESGTLHTGDAVKLKVDRDRRQAILLNHSATHLLHTALRQALGDHVNQKGSYVSPDRLRFDFSHFEPVKAEEMAEVDRRVNEFVRRNLLIEAKVTDMDGARDAGATMLFGEKYGDEVRMVRMGEVSLELCGGTHTKRTGDIGLFKILGEGSVQAGVRRIEAVTGATAVAGVLDLQAKLEATAKALRSRPDDVADRAAALLEKERKLSREVEQLKQKLATAGAGKDPADEAREVGGIKVLATRVEGIQLSGLRDFADGLRDKLGGGVVLAAAVEEGKMSAVCSVAKDQTGKVRAGDLLKTFFQITGGRGGGRPDFAQGGGGDPAKLDEALDAFYPMVEKALNGQ